jgi:hypothetical protein
MQPLHLITFVASAVAAAIPDAALEERQSCANANANTLSHKQKQHSQRQKLSQM